MHTRRARGACRAGLLAGAALALVGCSDSDSMNPIDWWHGLQGGRVAETRPPPPNADAPYPSLGSVPAKPTPPDAATRAKISSGLVADRANAQYAATLAPLSAAPKPQATPASTRAVPPVDPDASTASLPAASAPPRPPQGPPQPPLPNRPVSPPRPAPVARVDSTPLAAADVPAPADAEPPAAIPSSPIPPSPVPSSPAARPAAPTRVASARPTSPPASSAASDAVPLPNMPDSPPPVPRFTGAGVPAVTAPTPPPVAPPAPPKPPAPVYAGGPVTVPFQPGSSVLPTDVLAALKALAQKRGDAAISVSGYGEAPTSTAAAQQAALPLALARARAIAANLLAAGVPSNSIRISAEAMGTGGAARIVAN